MTLGERVRELENFRHQMNKRLTAHRMLNIFFIRWVLDGSPDRHKAHRDITEAMNRLFAQDPRSEIRQERTELIWDDLKDAVQELLDEISRAHVPWEKPRPPDPQFRGDIHR